ncbi:sugar ABC transporter permease [Candidatus Aerophobetes bacterium]|uniref:Sugar ABC transporter permease n=1 Tax=Aerophobetes bacterium TaxID=2030807 RepID=A0A662D8J1_UNCAE|nr:MAG: sugar ABC transporter permease [Candidatus Aerophobetes bacterium]
MSNAANGAVLIRRGLSDTAIKRLFVLPTIILLICINIFPLIWSLGLSFADYSAVKPRVPGVNPNWIGGKNYKEVLMDKAIWQYFFITFKYVIISVAGEFFIGFGVALLLNRDFKAKGLITTLILLPMMMSMAVVGLFWKLLWNPGWGIINYMLGLPKDFAWLANPKLALIAVAITDIWMWSPFVMLLSLAGLSAIPEYLYEAAEIDRASWWFKFRRITLPLVSPLLLIALIFRTMEAFKTFDIAFVMTGGGPGTATELIAINLYRLAFQQWNTGKASAFAYIVLIMIIAISNIYIKYLNKAKEM